MYHETNVSIGEKCSKKRKKEFEHGRQMHSFRFSYLKFEYFSRNLKNRKLFMQELKHKFKKSIEISNYIKINQRQKIHKSAVEPSSCTVIHCSIELYIILAYPQWLRPRPSV